MVSEPLQGGTRASVAAPLGSVLSVNGSQATIRLRAPSPSDRDEAHVTVGKFLGIRTKRSLVLGVLTEISIDATGKDAGSHAIGSLDLLGEITANQRGAPHFDRGVKEYPTIGDTADLIGSEDLRVVFDHSRSDSIQIGQLQQDTSLGAYVNVDHLVTKHFAVFGTTGVGKSSGVALILQEILKARDDLRILLIDPHNEYGRCFNGSSQVLMPKNLKLPFWLLDFEEIVDVFFRGRPGVEDEVAILSELIPIAKGNVAHTRQTVDRPTLRKTSSRVTGFTLDTPVPYRIEDLVALIDESMGKLENRSTWSKYHRLLTRIETARHDPRYAFMFENANVGGDTMVDTLSQLFRLPPNGRPMTIMQLAGFPAEVVDCVVSVLSRMAFEFGLWSDGAFPLLVVCEEAHRYAPADRAVGFGPTRKAISRIAKEGRKYGVFLGLITQRPAELDPTILSQCSTLFAMRMTNDRDQALLRSAVSDTAANLLSFLPTLATGEVFAFGEGVALPTRLRFQELPAAILPKSEMVNADGAEPVAEEAGNASLASIVARWRGVAGKPRLEPREPAEGARPA